MDQNQLDRMENMISDLIKMVANNNTELQDVKKEVSEVKKDLNNVKEVNEVKSDLNNIKKDLNEMKQDLNDVKKEQMTTNQILTDMRADQDFIWEKAAKNERELAKLKRHLQL